MQRIVPNLWFDHTASEAADFYVATFPDARITATQRYPTEGLLDFQADLAGEVLTVDFEIAGYRFTAINAGPEFQVNESLSFMLTFDPSADPDAVAHLDALWARLADGGRVLMPLAGYAFSGRYGWLADRCGVTWQLMLTDGDGERRPFIMPSLLFGGAAQNRAREAVDHYTALFGGRLGTLATYPAPVGPAAAGSVMYADFELLGQWFAAMDSAGEPGADFNCGVSLLVECADQAELDRYWEQLSAVPEAEQCGWCADRFGVSWQLVPANLGELMAAPGAFPKLMEMKKIDIAAFG